MSRSDQINREWLAWAAGFYDGEGCTVVKNRGCGIAIAISQKDSEVLHRFRNAVLNLGYVNGPHINTWSPDGMYQYQVSNFEHCQAVIAMLWPFLSSIKRNQAVVAINYAKQHRPAWDHTQKLSRYYGVSRLHKRNLTKPYTANIRVNGMLHWLGAYATEVAAAQAVDNCIRCNGGNLAKLNFPNDITQLASDGERKQVSSNDKTRGRGCNGYPDCWLPGSRYRVRHSCYCVKCGNQH